MLHHCTSTNHPLQWTKIGIVGKSPGNTITQAKISLTKLLEEEFVKWFGMSWTDMQTQAIHGVPEEQSGPNIEVAVSSHTVNDAATWVIADSLLTGCNTVSGASKEDAVAVCHYLYANPTTSTKTIGSCTMGQGGFGIYPSPAPIDAFHVDEWFQIHIDDSIGVLNAAWRTQSKQNTYVINKCKALIAEGTWDTPPIASLNLTDSQFWPRFTIYGGPTDIKKKYKSPCRA
jgi:predicted small secreted protein